MQTVKSRNDVFKLSFVHTKYDVDEENRTVTAKVKVKFPAFAKNRHFIRPNNDCHDVRAAFRKYPKTFIGKATCNPNDTFDIEKGKKIARARADKMAYNSFNMYIREMIDVYMDIFCKGFRTLQKITDIKYKKKEYLDSLTKESIALDI
jgi:hypothetical protein